MFTVSIRDKSLQWLHPSTLFALFFWPIEAQLLHLWETRQVEINLNCLLMWRKMSAEVHRMVSLVIAGCRATQSSWCSHRPNHYNIYADISIIKKYQATGCYCGYTLYTWSRRYVYKAAESRGESKVKTSSKWPTQDSAIVLWRIRGLLNPLFLHFKYVDVCVSMCATKGALTSSANGC